MKIVVIGGSGFIGSRLVKGLLQAGHEVRIFDRKPSASFDHLVTKGDVRDRDALVKMLRGIQAVYNLAAEHRDDIVPRSLYHDVNVQGADNTTYAAELNSINRVIFTSSVAVYGFTEKDTDEKGEFRPFNEYGRTKLEAEEVYRQWVHACSERSLTIVRPAVVFGEGNRGNVYNLLNQIASNKFLMIGNGKNYKSMAYVGNVAAFLEHALYFNEGEHIFNYADKPDFDMDKLVCLVKRKLNRGCSAGFKVPFSIGYAGGVACDIAAKITGKRFPISAIRVKKFCSNTQFSSRFIHSTGFMPPVSLQEGLEKTIEFEFLDERTSEHHVVFFTE
jgi:nucleoside-diphosphate-sugar epimerase